MTYHYSSEDHHAILGVPKFGFVLGILAMVIGTRMPLDDSYTSIGGGLSYPFRLLLICGALAKFLRSFGEGILPFWEFTWRFIYVIESIMMTWLFLATPYLLRCFMKDRINIGPPGRPLQAWLLGLSLVTAGGVGLAAGFAHRFWTLVRLAGAASTVPVLQAIQQYNLLTTPTGPYRGRGLAVTQALACFERYFQLVMLGAAIGELFQAEQLSDQDTNQQEWSLGQQFLEKLRHNSMLGHIWTRAALHGLFINMLDEMQQTGAPTTTTSPNNSPGRSCNGTGGSPLHSRPGSPSGSTSSVGSEDGIVELGTSLIVSTATSSPKLH